MVISILDLNEVAAPYQFVEARTGYAARAPSNAKTVLNWQTSQTLEDIVFAKLDRKNVGCASNLKRSTFSDVENK